MLVLKGIRLCTQTYRMSATSHQVASSRRILYTLPRRLPRPRRIPVLEIGHSCGLFHEAARLGFQPPMSMSSCALHIWSMKSPQVQEYKGASNKALVALYINV